jgi:hypothetical protein
MSMRNPFDLPITVTVFKVWLNCHCLALLPGLHNKRILVSLRSQTFKSGEIRPMFTASRLADWRSIIEFYLLDHRGAAFVNIQLVPYPHQTRNTSTLPDPPIDGVAKAARGGQMRLGT